MNEALTKEWAAHFQKMTPAERANAETYYRAQIAKTAGTTSRMMHKRAKDQLALLLTIK